MLTLVDVLATQTVPRDPVVNVKTMTLKVKLNEALRIIYLFYINLLYYNCVQAKLSLIEME